jgi:hypothetical protein
MCDGHLGEVLTVDDLQLGVAPLTTHSTLQGVRVPGNRPLQQLAGGRCIAAASRQQGFKLALLLLSDPTMTCQAALHDNVVPMQHNKID